MLTGTFLGSEMLQNELLILKILVGAGFIGWMMLMYVHAVLLDHPAQPERSDVKDPSLNEKEEDHSTYTLPKAA